MISSLNYISRSNLLTRSSMLRCELSVYVIALMISPPPSRLIRLSSSSSSDISRIVLLYLPLSLGLMLDSLSPDPISGVLISGVTL